QLKQADAEIGKGLVIPGDERRIELPYLQLALINLWNREGAASASAMRESTLVALGGVGQIVRNHVDTVMRRLTPQEQEICARMFDRLVTAIGTKIAYPTAALAAAEVVGPRVSQTHLDSVLRKLTPQDARILKPVM